MLNVEARVEGSRLILEVDLDQEFGESKSGKTTVVASTQGNQSVPEQGYTNIKFGLNVYK